MWGKSASQCKSYDIYWSDALSQQRIYMFIVTDGRLVHQLLLQVAIHVPNYTSKWQKHKGLNNTPKTVMHKDASTCLMWPFNHKSNILIITPIKAKNFNTIFNSTLCMRATKSNELVGHNPAEITIFNFLKIHNNSKMIQTHTHVIIRIGRKITKLL